MDGETAEDTAAPTAPGAAPPVQARAEADARPPTPSPPGTAPDPANADGRPSEADRPDGGPGGQGRRGLARADTLRDRIVEHLKRTGADSISGITRHLLETGAGGGTPAHRLTIAGYLQALAEAGVLREMDRPPSKLYQVQNPEAHWSLHQRVHRLLLETPRSEGERVRLALAALQLTLGRPVFHAELLHAGFQSVPEDLRRVVVGDATRRAYRDLFTRRSSPHIVVPPRDPLLALQDDDPLLYGEAVAELLRRVLAKATGSEHLVAERPAGPQQAQLDVGGEGGGPPP